LGCGRQRWLQDSSSSFDGIKILLLEKPPQREKGFPLFTQPPLDPALE
jgi:hypothetical protein